MEVTLGTQGWQPMHDAHACMAHVLYINMAHLSIQVRVWKSIWTELAIQLNMA